MVSDVLYSTKASSPYDVAVVQLRHLPPEVVVSRLATSFTPGRHDVTVTLTPLCVLFLSSQEEIQWRMGLSSESGSSKTA